MFRQAAIFGNGIGPAHHVDRVHIELARDSGRRLVLGECDHAHAGDQIDDGVGVADGGAVGAFAARVIGGITFAIGGNLARKGGKSGVQIGFGGIKAHHQRANLGAQEMVGARGAKRCQRAQFGGVYEIQHRVGIIEMPDHVVISRDHSPNRGHQTRGHSPAFGGGQSGADRAAKGLLACGLCSKPVHRLLDCGQGQIIAGAGIIIPCEQPMRFQHDALGIRVFFAEFAQPEAQLKPRTFPWQPADLIPENLGCQGAGIGRGGDGDDRIGVHVINMLARHKSVQRRVDGGCARVQVKGAMGQVAHHLILKRDATIDALERAQFFHVKR